MSEAHASGSVDADRRQRDWAGFAVGLGAAGCVIGLYLGAIWVIWVVMAAVF
jgi:hypothetical protein